MKTKILTLLSMAVFSLSACSYNKKPVESVNHSSHSIHKISSPQQYIEHMIPHHQEAVQSSEYVITRTDNQQLKLLLSKVITNQNKEIAIMKQWLQDWYNIDYQNNFQYTQMMGDLTKFQGKELDNTYIKDMIVHHQAALDISKSLLEIEGVPKELQSMSKNIIQTQTKEIQELNSLIKN